MNTIVCFVVGLLTAAGALGAFHLWVRLWNRIVTGSWRFELGDADYNYDEPSPVAIAHLAVACGTFLLMLVSLALYALGCTIRTWLGV